MLKLLNLLLYNLLNCLCREIKLFLDCQMNFIENFEIVLGSKKLLKTLQCCSRALICFRVTRIGHNCDAYLLHKELSTIRTNSIELIHRERYNSIDFKRKDFTSKVSFHCRVPTLAECDKKGFAINKRGKLNEK